MTIENFLESLPTNFRHEKSFLTNKKINDFKKLGKLSDLEINKIQQESSLCTLNNLKKIKAIAIFKKELEISPPVGYLLLHCGISSIESLSRLSPYEIKERIGRLERNLRTKSKTKITLSILKKWINKANQIYKSI